MHPLVLHEFHHELRGRFGELNGMGMINDYGDWLAEHAALGESVGVIDLSFRGRICLTGADRVRFLHGQITNDVKRLQIGEGCYAALVTAKGKMQSDLNVFCLADELLLDFEPGLTDAISQRLEKYLVADDVQIVDVAPHYGLLSVQGPKAEAAVRGLEIFSEIPGTPFRFIKFTDATLGEIYLMNQPRLRSSGFDLFVPTQSLGAVADKLIAGAKANGGTGCGWQAFETARIEAGIPRFGMDMDETNLPPECGIDERAVSYNKGCYIGQEVLNRIHTIGRVNRELRVLDLGSDLKSLPEKGDKLFQADKEIGYVTSAVNSPRFKTHLALGYVRREADAIGAELILKTTEGEVPVRIISLKRN